MRLIDLFCCEGGAGTGYAHAGFDVYGVDLDRKAARRYPFPIHVGDALKVMDDLLAGRAVDFTHPSGEVEWLTLDEFIAAHASPPCQAYSITKHSHGKEHPDLLEPTRAALIATGLPYIIENVVGAPLIDPVLLCGTMFNLSAIDVDGEPLVLQRHRLFESNVWLMSAGGCSHDGRQVAGVYGGGRHRNVSDRDSPQRRGGYTPLGSVRAELMDMPWATQHGLTQAIPPAYTEFLGRQVMDHLKAAVA